MGVASRLRLEREGEQADLFSLEEINALRAPIGTRILAQDWSRLPDDLKDFLTDPDPLPERIAEVMPRFLLPRERLLEVIAQAGRQPHVPGGGEMLELTGQGGSATQMFTAIDKQIPPSPPDIPKVLEVFTQKVVTVAG